MAGLVGWIAFRQVAPRDASTQDPQDAVQDVARVSPGLSFAVRPERRIGYQGLQDLPLLVGKVQDVYSAVFSRAGRGPLYGPSRVYEMASRLGRGVRNILRLRRSS